MLIRFFGPSLDRICLAGVHALRYVNTRELSGLVGKATLQSIPSAEATVAIQVGQRRPAAPNRGPEPKDLRISRLLLKDVVVLQGGWLRQV